MIIRRAAKKDSDRILELLSQVLEVHAAIRPDYFIPGTTKYTKEELSEIIANDSKPIFVYEDDEGVIQGYAFCVINEPVESTNCVPFRSVYIDDLCVDEAARGMHVGSALFKYVKEFAKSLDCYEVTLNVWEGNDNAKTFYQNMGLTTLKTYMEYIL